MGTYQKPFAAKNKKNFGIPATRTASIYLAPVLESVTEQLVRNAGDATKALKRKRIMPHHIQKGIGENQEFRLLLDSVIIPQGGVRPPARDKKRDGDDEVSVGEGNVAERGSSASEINQAHQASASIAINPPDEMAGGFSHQENGNEHLPASPVINIQEDELPGDYHGFFVDDSPSVFGNRIIQPSNQLRLRRSMRDNQ